MQSPDSKSLTALDSRVAPHQTFRGHWWIRLTLLVLHITILGAAISLTPDGYFFQLGEYTGTVLVFSTIILWWLLLSARTRKAITIFCVLALGQAGFMASVGLHFRAQDRALRPIIEELALKRNRWESEMGQFRMDPLFEMTSGKRRLSIAELRELQTQARTGKAKLSEVQSDLMGSVADAERRIAGVSFRAARDFRSGFDSTRPAFEEQVTVMQDYFTETDQLAEFLIDRQGQYSKTPNGLLFKRDRDAEAFNRQVDALAHLQEQINSLRQRALSGDSRK
jgi:hypothetical protein